MTELSPSALTLLELVDVKRDLVQSSMSEEKQQESRRVTFEYPLPVQMMAIDGTWRRSCAIKDVSERGATLQVEVSIEGLSLTEFFLLLSSTGLAYRRCQLERVNGQELEVGFLRQKSKTSRAKQPSEVA
jgi:hypothetical protein